LNLNHREKYLERKSKAIHNRVSDLFEHISDGEFEEAHNLINSTIKQLYDLRKNMEP